MDSNAYLDEILERHRVWLSIPLNGFAVLEVPMENGEPVLSLSIPLNGFL